MHELAFELMVEKGGLFGGTEVVTLRGGSMQQVRVAYTCSILVMGNVSSSMMHLHAHECVRVHVFFLLVTGS